MAQLMLVSKTVALKDLLNLRDVSPADWPVWSYVQEGELEREAVRYRPFPPASCQL